MAAKKSINNEINFISGAFLTILASALFMGIIFGLIISATSKTFLNKALSDAQNSGSGLPTVQNCVADECLSIENLEYPVAQLPTDAKTALDASLADEYKTLATIEKAIDKYGMVKPFSMLLRVQEKRILTLKSLYDKYGLQIPTNMYQASLLPYGSFEDACAESYNVELEKIQNYKNKYIGQVGGFEDLLGVFEFFAYTSENTHLPAFSACM
jgi:hypothetical protein